VLLEILSTDDDSVRKLNKRVFKCVLEMFRKEKKLAILGKCLGFYSSKVFKESLSAL
jgi:hypothetical protein